MEAPYTEIVVNQAFLDDFFFVREESEPSEIHQDAKDDFWKFLKKSGKSAVFLTDYPSDEAIDEAIKENPLLEKLVEYTPITMRSAQFNSTLDRKSAILRGGSPFKLFLLDEVEEAVSTDISACGYQVLSSDQLGKQWQLYSQDRDDTTILISRQIELSQRASAFLDWSRFGDFQHPVHALLLYDPYIFSQNEPTHKNLKPLLVELLGGIAQQGEFPVQILILADTEVDSMSKVSLAEDLRKYLCRKLGLQDLTVVIEKIDDHSFRAVNQGERHIDRWILTNYFFVKASHGFNVFRENGSIPRASDIEFKFLLHPKHQGVPFSFLKKVHRYMEQMNPSCEFRLFRGLKK